MENESTPDVEAVEAVEAVETPEDTEDTETVASATGRVHVSDDDFFEACEKVAASDNPSIEAISNLTGLKPGSVTQRRNALNSRFQKAGLDLRLTPLPKGGGRKYDILSAADRLRQIQARIKGGKSTEEVEREVEESASE